MATTQVTGDLIADGAITAAKLSNVTTDTISEGTALYYTDARVASYLSANSYATEGYVTTAVNNLIDAAPASLDTLNELAAALNDDANFATTVTNALATKLNLSGGNITGNLSVDTNVLFVDTVNDRVGIRTSSPETEFDILGTLTIQSSAANIILKDTGASDNEDWRIVANGGPLQIQSRTNAGVNTSRVLFDNNGDVSFYEDTGSSVKLFWDASAESLGIGTSSPAQKLDIIGAVQATDFISSASAYTIGTVSDTNLEFATSANAIPRMIFRVNGNVERMRIDSSGNVGIGTSSPDSYYSKNLVVSASTEGGITIVSNSTDGAYLMFADGTSGADRYRGYINYYHLNNSLVFASDGAERMRIDSSGRVGIGTTSPALAGTGYQGIHINNADSTKGSSIILSSGNTNYNYIYSGGTNGREFLIENPGDQVFRPGSSEKMRITSGGDVFIGTTSAIDPNSASIVNAYSFPKTGAEFRANGSTPHYAITFRNVNGLVGSITTSGSSTSYSTSSDYRLKEDLKPIANPLDRVISLNPINFAWKSDGSRVDGFLAHEVQEVVPEAISGVKDEVDANGNPVYQGIDQSKLVPLLAGAIQELKDIVDQQQIEIDNLKAQLK